MKKKLEAELISIAHRILKMKNRSELVQLQKEARNLYEKLSVMVFVEENFSDSKPTIGHAEVVDKMEQIFEAEHVEEDKEELAAKDSKGENLGESKVDEASTENKTENDVDKSEDDSFDKEDLAKTDSTSDRKDDIETSEVKPESHDAQSSEKGEENTDDSAEKGDKSENIFTPKIDLVEDESKVEPREINQPEKSDKGSDGLESSSDEVQKEANHTADISDDDDESQEASGESDTKFSESEKTESIIAAESNTQIPNADATDNQQDDKLNPSFTFEPTFDKKDEKPQFGYGNSGQLPLDDLYGNNYKDPEFIKPEDLAKEQSTSRENVIPISRPADNSNVFAIKKDDPKQPLSLNDRLSKGITIGLNDRIAFMKHLFNNSSEDYNRVLSQLITFDNYSDAVNFIETMVKPDYNNWEGKDDYSVRFMEIIERKFN